MLYRGPMGGGAASGKIGAMIASHCAQGQYLKSRVKSTNPRSELQHVPRNALARLAAFWTEQLTAPQQAAWATYAANVTWLNRLGDTVHLSGQMEFIRSNAPRLQADVLYGDPFDFPLLGIVADAPTIFDRGDPGPTPTINMVPGNDYLTMVYDNTADWVTSDTSNAMLVYVAIPKNSSVSFFRRRTRLAGIVHASDATGSFNFLNQWLPAIAYRQKWTAWWCISRADGRLTRAVPVAPFDTGPPPPPPWSDDFNYPDGSLNGEGDWTTPGTILHAGTVTISAHRAFWPQATDADAVNTSATLPANWSVPWSLTWQFERDIVEDSFTEHSVGVGSGTTPSVNVNLEWFPGSGAANRIDAVNLYNMAGTLLATVASVPCTTDTTHALELQFDGTNVNVLLDSVQILTTVYTPADQSALIWLLVQTLGTGTGDNFYVDSMAMSRR